MKKKDLKTGMMVQHKGESERHVILKGTNECDVMCNVVAQDCEISGTRLMNFWPLDRYYEDLTSPSHMGNINKVWSMYGQLLWERKETEELTLDQVCKELGRNIKIIK